jgi:hypothetical protein
MSYLPGRDDRGAYLPRKNLMGDQYFRLIDVLIWDSLKSAVAIYGIEGTEQKIKELYRNMPVARDMMLDVFYQVYGATKSKDSQRHGR